VNHSSSHLREGVATALRISLTLDSTSPGRLRGFRELALGHEAEPLPAPFRTREDPAGNEFCVARTTRRYPRSRATA
jgi:hypothetical protein